MAYVHEIHKSPKLEHVESSNGNLNQHNITHLHHSPKKTHFLDSSTIRISMPEEDLDDHRPTSIDSSSFGSSRLHVAKVLSFAHGASQVAWSQFSTLWLISVGFTPSQTGILKTLAMLSKTLSQPLWAALADLRFMGWIHPSLDRTSPHVAAMVSLVLTVAIMEVLRNYGPGMRFETLAALRVAGATVGGGANLIDAMVAQLCFGAFPPRPSTPRTGAKDG